MPTTHKEPWSTRRYGRFLGASLTVLALATWAGFEVLSCEAGPSPVGGP